MSGVPLKVVYAREDLTDFDPQASLGAPGEFPYTRGIHPTMYRGKLWTMRQYAGFGTARAMGGMLRAIETGYVQREIQKAAYDYQQSVERNERIIVGVNRYYTEREQPIPILRIDPAIEQEQVERVRALRARRDVAHAAKSIAEVESRARSGENLMPAILSAVEAYATVGEICDAMRRAFGEHHETLAL